MAPPAGTLRVGRYFAALFALFALLYLVVFLPGHRHTPKLGLDLVGGREVIFKAVVVGSSNPPTASQMEQAKQIMEERVNASGTTGATVVIEGDDRINISIPGGTSTDVEALGKAAVLNFRPLIAPATPISCGAAAVTPSGSSTGTPSSGSPSPSATGSPSASTSPSATAGTTSSAAQSPNSVRERPLAAATTSPAAGSSGATSGTTSTGATTSAASPSGTPATSPSVSAATSPSGTGAAAAQKCVKDPFATILAQKSLGLKAIPNTEAQFNALTDQQKAAIAAGLAFYDCSATDEEPDLANRYYVACDTSGAAAYLLGTIIVPGRQIDEAAAEAPSQSGQGNIDWSVRLTLKSAGDDAWSTWTSQHNTSGASSATVGGPDACSPTTTPCSNYVGFTLDGRVISAPVTQSAINHQPTSITGGFDQKRANNLADQLNFGALPTNFKLELNQNISATLGAAQLKAGLLAGGIGLILVIIYSLLYYRALGLVTIASLIVSGGLTWAMLVILGNQIGYSLDLAGIAGFIVAIGITADSFVVFFERIKDEVHEGRSVRVAVPRAWARARRTVLSADTVSFLAAAILYYFAAGEVRGFAFTLGLSTVLDLIVVFLFTHPLVSVLSRSRAFGSARFTGLNAVREGGVVKGGDDADAAPRGRRERPARTTRGSAGTVVLEKETAVDEADEADGTQPTTAAARARRRRGMPAPVVEVDEAEAIVDEDADETEADVVEDPVPTRTRRRRPTRTPVVEVEAVEVEAVEVEAVEVEADEVEAVEVEAVEVEADDETEDVVPEEPADETPDEAVEETRPRRRTTPAKGTAAERAAARRARLKAQQDSDEKGTS